ncbi:hypothetical protein BDD12DRAFT_838796 [Trichophaea hybrida]|nr:hypothetical protein BDD12DRAFT_838796 [Trichophaea hybrida]
MPLPAQLRILSRSNTPHTSCSNSCNMPPQRTSLIVGDIHVFVRPLTPRDTEDCYRVLEASHGISISFEELSTLVRDNSPTSLGIFTTPPVPPSTRRPPTPSLAPHPEILLGFIIGETDEGSGEGATLKISGMWVLPEEVEKGVGQVLLKGWVDRMKDGRVAKRIVKSMKGGLGDGKGEGKEEEMVMGWLRDSGFAVRDGDGQEGFRMVLDCF